MAKRKTFLDYEQDIRTAHAEGDDKTVHARVGKWADLVPLAFLVANNEKKPYSSEELQGCEVISMPPKKLLGFDQTGDYICVLPEHLDEEGKPMKTGVFWDRKEQGDWYSTILHNHERFYNECERSLEIPECEYMIVGVECTFDKYMTYQPLIVKKGTGKNGAKPKYIRSPGASQASRAALVKHLPVRFGFKVNVLWHGGRSRAAQSLVNYNRMWLKYNYAKVLGL